MDKDDKKKKAAIKATKSAEKKAVMNKVAKEAKKLGDKALLEVAATLPAGGAKTLIAKVHAHDAALAEIKKWNLVKKGIRADLREMKIELRPLDHVLKLRAMDPEDAKSFKATEALYTQTLGLELSPQQKASVEEINKKREDARKAMASIHGDDAGKEVGTGTDEEAEEDAPAIPAKNEAISGLAAAPQATH